MQLTIGQQAPEFSLRDISGKTISLTDYKDKKLLLCFFRYVGCPFCHLTFVNLLKQYPDFAKEGLSVVAFFQSSQERVIKVYGKYHAPFPIIADPDKKVYYRYGVQSELMGWPRTLVKVPQAVPGWVENKIFQGKLEGDLNLIPAYFLIGSPELTIHDAYYGKHFLDWISLDDIHEFIRTCNHSPLDRVI